MEIHTHDHPGQVAGEALRASLFLHREKPILLLVSGGSAFEMLSYIDDAVLGKHLTFGVLDERYSTDASVNNFAQLREISFFTRACTRGVSLIDTQVRLGESIQALQERWEYALRSWVATHPEGVVIVTMGIGEDGHTAGMFPSKDISMFENDAWAVAYYIPPSVNAYTDRITTTHTFLRTIVDDIYVLVKGENKKQALAQLQAPTGNIHETPARILRELSNVHIFTDMLT